MVLRVGLLELICTDAHVQRCYANIDYGEACARANE